KDPKRITATRRTRWATGVLVHRWVRKRVVIVVPPPCCCPERFRRGPPGHADTEPYSARHDRTYLLMRLDAGCAAPGSPSATRLYEVVSSAASPGGSSS